jgi:hypothetical protein
MSFKQFFYQDSMNFKSFTSDYLDSIVNGCSSAGGVYIGPPRIEERGPVICITPRLEPTKPDIGDAIPYDPHIDLTPHTDPDPLSKEIKKIWIDRNAIELPVEDDVPAVIGEIEETVKEIKETVKEIKETVGEATTEIIDEVVKVVHEIVHIVAPIFIEL